jgi:hypothetical protein
MTMKSILKRTLLCLLVAGIPAAADTILLQDGDQLSGLLVEVSDEVAVFRTELAGQIMVPLTRVVSITTARDVQIVFKDGGSATGRLVTSGGEMRFVPAKGGDPYSITTRMLASVAPMPPEDLHQGDPVPTADLTSSLASGVQYTSGNDDRVSLYSRLRLGADRNAYSWRSDAYIASGEGFDGIGELRVSAATRWFPDATIQPAAELAFERSDDQLLELRATLTVGAYHAFTSGPRHELTGLLGISVETERWDGGDLDSLDGFPRSGWGAADAAFYYHTLDRHYEDTNLRLKLDLRHVLHAFDRLAWEEQITLSHSLTGGGDWRAAYESSVLFPLTDRLRLNLNLRVDYDSDPAFRYLDEWRTTVGAGIEWSF